MRFSSIERLSIGFLFTALLIRKVISLLRFNFSGSIQVNLKQSSQGKIFDGIYFYKTKRKLNLLRLLLRTDFK